MSRSTVDLYPFVFSSEMDLSLAETSHIWTEGLSGVLALITGNDNPAIPFERKVSLDVPLVLIWGPVQVDGFCRIYLHSTTCNNTTLYTARLNCYPKGSDTKPYLKLTSQADRPELALNHLGYSFASYLFAIEGEVESVV